MALRLALENEFQLPDGGPTSIQVTGRRGIDIGRDQHLDWTLPDPDRFVSGKHCEIRYRDGAYWLHDVSSNGTFVNGSERRLHEPHRLRDGDRLEIGRYIVAVSLDGEDAAAPPLAPKAAEPSAMFHRPTGAQLWDFPGDAAPPAARDDFHPAQPAAGHADFLDWAAELPSIQPDAAIDPWHAPPPFPGPGPAATSPPPRDRETRPPTGSDVWGAGLSSSAPSEGWSVTQPAFEPLPPYAEPAPRYAENGTAAPGATRPPSSPPQSPPHFQPQIPQHIPPQSHPQAQPQNQPQTPGWNGRDAPAPQPLAAAPFSEPPPRPPEPAPPPRLDAEFVRRLARGAGLPEELLAAKDPGDLAEELGMLMRLVVENLKQLLSARAESRGLVGASHLTMIQAFDNNPLKFSPTPEDVLRIMFGPRTTSYLDPRQSMKQSFDEVKAHQLNTFLAMQQAVSLLVQDLDPAAIETSVEERGLGAVIGSRKARLWDAYAARWQAKAARHDHGMLDAFMVYFSECYRRNASKIP